jgi:hypothetical protein
MRLVGRGSGSLREAKARRKDSLSRQALACEVKECSGCCNDCAQEVMGDS